jgi:hypothetical protein
MTQKNQATPQKGKVRNISRYTSNFFFGEEVSDINSCH